MKKVIATVLTLALLLSCAAALAETPAKEYTGSLTIDEKFTIKWVAPEGYDVEATTGDTPGFMVAALVPGEDNPARPMMLLHVAYDEQYADVSRINDLDAETLAEIEATFREEDQVDITYMETNYGTKLMVVKETYEGVDYVDFYTIYMGYTVELILTQTDAMEGAPITDEQIAVVLQFLSDMDFVPVA